MSAASPSATNRRLTVIIAADVDSFRRGLHVAQRQLESTSRSMIAIGQNLAFSLGLPLAAIATAAQKMSFDFESATNKIRTLTGTSEDDVKKLEAAVVSLSDHLGVDRVQMMQAAYAAASAGITDAAHVMGVLEQTAKGTVIGLGDQLTLTRVLTQVMSAYGAENVNAARAMNALLLAVNQGNFDAPQFAESIGDIIPLTAAMNVSFEQISAAVSAYTKISGDAIKATTSFRNVLTDVLTPSKRAEDLWNQIFPEGGVARVRQLMQEDFIGAFRQIAEALKGRPELIDALFDNARGLVGFLGTFISQGKQVQLIYDRMISDTTALNEAWNKILLDGHRIWGILIGMLKNAGVAIGDVLAPATKDLILTIAAVLRYIRPWLVENTRLIAQITLITVGTIALITSLGVLGLAISVIWRGLNTILAVVSALTIGLPALGAALVSPWMAGAAAVYLFIELLMTIPENLRTVQVEQVKTQRGLIGTMAVARAVGNDLEDTAGKAAGFWGRVWEATLDAVKMQFAEFQLAVDRIILSGFERMFNNLNALNKSGYRDFLIPDAVIDGLRSAVGHMQSSVQAWEQILEDLRKKNENRDVLGLDGILERIRQIKQEWITPEELETLFDVVNKKGVGGLNLGDLTGLTEDGGADKTANAIDRITKLIIEQSHDLQALTGRWSDFERETIKGLATIGDAARDGGLDPELVKRYTDAYIRLREEIERAPLANEGFAQIADLIKAEARELGALSARWTDFERQTAEGLAAIDEAASRFRLPVDEVERYRSAYIRLREEIERQNKAIVIDIKSQLTGALEEVTRGILRGTVDWRNILDVFADVGVSIMVDIFKQILAAKTKFDKIIIQNFGKQLPAEIQKTVDAIKEGKGEFESMNDLEEAIQILKQGSPVISESGAIPERTTAPDGGIARRTDSTLEIDLAQLGAKLRTWLSEVFSLDWLATITKRVRGWFDDLFASMDEGIDGFTTEALASLDKLKSFAGQLFTGLGLTGQSKGQKLAGIFGTIGSVAGSFATVMSISSLTSSVGELTTAVSELQGGLAGAVPLAAGGVVTRPTRAIVGEAGPEAVVPLARISSMFEQKETTVIINSPTPAFVRKSETSDERRIEVIIDDAVARSFRTGGKASQVLERSFGLRRSGGLR